MKKVLILSGSPRKDGNSDLLCSEFMRGAQESGNEVQKIFVRSKKIVPCNACYYCRDHGGKCALNDDMSEILDAMQAADVIVMASPVYFYSIDAQMKIIIDRSLARWTNIPNKEFYFIIRINRITISAGASGLLLSFCSAAVSCIMPQKASFSKTFCHKLPDFA